MKKESLRRPEHIEILITKTLSDQKHPRCEISSYNDPLVMYFFFLHIQLFMFIYNE